MERPVPHSITSWLTNVWCVSEELGVGFGDPMELTSFQAFFAEVLAPHSIKNGENFNLLVHVSNYVNYSFPVSSRWYSNNLAATFNSRLKSPSDFRTIWCSRTR